MNLLIRPFTEPIHDLPSRSGRACRVLCPILVVLASCATDSERVCAAPQIKRIERVTLPTNNESARALALNGDKTVDTQIGMVLGTIRSQLPEANFEIINARLENDIEWNLAISRCDDDTVDVALLPTSNADGIVHMTGEIAAGRFVA